jgi:hypothetical protein
MVATDTQMMQGDNSESNCAATNKSSRLGRLRFKFHLRSRFGRGDSNCFTLEGMKGIMVFFQVISQKLGAKY